MLRHPTCIYVQKMFRTGDAGGMGQERARARIAFAPHPHLAPGPFGKGPIAAGISNRIDCARAPRSSAWRPLLVFMFDRVNVNTAAKRRSQGRMGVHSGPLAIVQPGAIRHAWRCRFDRRARAWSRARAGRI